MPNNIDDFIKAGMDAGLTDDEIKSEVSRMDSTQMPEKKGFIDTVKGAAQEFKGFKERGLSFREAAGEIARGTLDAQSRNVGTERTKTQKVIEGVAKPVGFGVQVAGEAIGKKLGGKKGSAFAAASVAGTESLIQEQWENLIGQQDDSPEMSAAQPFLDAGSAAAIDVIFNVAFDDIIPGVKKKLLKVPLLSKLVGKGKAAQEQLAGEVVAKAGKAYELLQTEVGNVKKYFIDSGMGKIKWWEATPNKFGKFKPFGKLVNDKIIAQKSIELKPLLEQAKKSGVKLNFEEANTLLGKFRKKQLVKNLANSGLEEGALKEAAADGGSIIESVLKEIKKNGMDPVKAKAVATELMDGTYTTTGKGKIGLSPTAQRQVGIMLSSWIKSAVDGSAEILGEQRRRYLLNDMVVKMAVKVNKEVGKDIFAGLSPAQMSKVGLMSIGGLGLAVGGGRLEGPTGKVLQGLGILAAGSQVPLVRTALKGDAEKALFKELGEKAPGLLSKEVGGVPLKEVAGATARTTFQRLFNTK